MHRDGLARLSETDDQKIAELLRGGNCNPEKCLFPPCPPAVVMTGAEAVDPRGG